jgi:transposase
MAQRYEELTDEQWELVESYIPTKRRRQDGRGRPRRGDRAVPNGILWVLRSGARWRDLPDRFPPYSTCYRLFRSRIAEDVLRTVLEKLAEHLYESGKIDLSECFVDATFIGAKKGVSKSVKHAVARAPRSWQWQTLMVFQSPFTHKVLHQLKSPLRLVTM